MLVTVFFFLFLFLLIGEIFGVCLCKSLSLWSQAILNSSDLARIVAISICIKPDFVDIMQPRFFCIHRVFIFDSFASPPTAVLSRADWEADLHVHGWMVFSIVRFEN